MNFLSPPWFTAAKYLAVVLGLSGLGFWGGWETKAHFSAIQHANDVAAVAAEKSLANAEKAQCAAQIADANIKAAKELSEQSARLFEAENALARERSKAQLLNDKLQKALSDESRASKLSAAVLNYLSIVRSSYDAGAIDAESATNFVGQAKDTSTSP